MKTSTFLTAAAAFLSAGLLVAQRGADPSIAKARAAGVDTTVFSMQLGEPHGLPECGLFDLAGSPAKTCVVAQTLTDLIISVSGVVAGPVDPLKTFNTTIKLAGANCPAWLSGCMVFATVENGLLAGIFVRPDGRQVEQAVGRELQGKYGKSTTARERAVTPRAGSDAFTVTDLEWATLPGLHVEYRAVHDSTQKGLLRIETDALYERRRQQQLEIDKPKL